MTRSRAVPASMSVRGINGVSPWLLVDAALWVLVLIFTVWFRFDFVGSSTTDVLGGPGFWSVVAATVLLQWVVGVGRGLYTGGFVPRSSSEAAATAVIFVATTLLVFVGTQVAYLVSGGLTVPRSVVLMAGPTALVASLALRLLVRDSGFMGAGADSSTVPAVVFGAGSGGRQLVRQLRESVTAPYRPVAILDDDPTKQRLRIDGVRVAGTRSDLEAVAQRYGATTLVIAVPSLPSEDLVALRDRAEAMGLEVLVLPPVESLMRGRVAMNELRHINVNDLLGRKPARLNQTQIADYLRGKRILVTGAGGSIGSELCRQLSRFRPGELMMLDRDESGLHAVQLSIQDQAMLDGDDTILVSIRDKNAVREVFEKRRPQIVFHAAALKHMPLLESYPLEALKTNVLGTLNLLEAAEATGVETFVNISTDKAANPCSALGTSKRVAERLTAERAHRPTAGKYVSVRFGNVLGSRGSVLTVFEKQIRDGGPVTVTDREVNRFFMTIPEACQLVLQAAAVGDSGQTLVLDMGEPVKIDAVARTLIEHSGKNIEIVYTGLRENEKLAEELFDDTEEPVQSVKHEALYEVEVPALRIQTGELTAVRHHDEAKRWLDEHSYPEDIAAVQDLHTRG